jgi:hypothetical protein
VRVGRKAEQAPSQKLLYSPHFSHSPVFYSSKTSQSQKETDSLNFFRLDVGPSVSCLLREDGHLVQNIEVP